MDGHDYSCWYLEALLKVVFWTSGGSLTPCLGLRRLQRFPWRWAPPRRLRHPATGQSARQGTASLPIAPDLVKALVERVLGNRARFVGLLLMTRR